MQLDWRRAKGAYEALEGDAVVATVRRSNGEYRVKGWRVTIVCADGRRNVTDGVDSLGSAKALTPNLLMALRRR